MKQLVRMGLVMLEQGNTHALWITMQVLNELHMGMCTVTLSLFGAIFGSSVLFTVVCMCERRTAKGLSVRLIHHCLSSKCLHTVSHHTHT